MNDRALGGCSADAPAYLSRSQRPNILLVMTDQQRFDTIASLGNSHIYTPNLDRLVNRGVTFANAYSTCPVCVPSRYTVRTGCEPYTTRFFSNRRPDLLEGQPASVVERCGPYLASRMRALGYRTFGIGKFDSRPWNECLGYDVHLHSEELYASAEQRRSDAYAAWIASKHPAYGHVEQLMGERTEMYYMPQTSPLPASITVEAWVADRAIEQLAVRDCQPFFGTVSFVGPHPPVAPPIPFNRMYDPDLMPNPVRGNLDVDHMDEQIPWMNYAVWADDISDSHARAIKARYYGEITYIDDCIGRILDAVEARPDAEDTLVCFFSDHGEHLGDHAAWQKESFFEAACRVPLLLSWPAKVRANTRSHELTCLTDLFGICTTAAGCPEMRQGADVLGMLGGKAQPRQTLMGYHSDPGSQFFKLMLRQGDWKYVFMANGGRQQLFNVREDPAELNNLAEARRDMLSSLRDQAAAACDRPELCASLDGNGLRSFSFHSRPRQRIYQFDRSRGAVGFGRRTVAASSVGLPRDESTALLGFIDRIHESAPPFDNAPIRISFEGDLVVAGWVVEENKGPAAAVDIAIDGMPFPAWYGLSREDVAAAFHVPQYHYCGYHFSLPASRFGPGQHRLTVRAIRIGAMSYSEGAAVSFEVAPAIAHRVDPLSHGAGREPETAPPSSGAEPGTMVVRTSLSDAELDSALARLGRWFYPFQFQNGTRVELIDREVIGLHRSRAQAIFSTLDRQYSGRWPEVRCLDLACHEGWFSLQVAARGARFVRGIDVRPDRIQRAAFIRDSGGFSNAVYEVGDLFALNPERDGIYDLTFFLGIFYHLEDPMRALRIVRSLTRTVCVIEGQVARHSGSLKMAWGTQSHMRSGPACAVIDADPNHIAPGASVSLVPSLEALTMMLRAAGFSRVDLVEPAPGMHEQLSGGDRVIVFAYP
jgi:choline-sulfatase